MKFHFKQLFIFTTIFLLTACGKSKQQIKEENEKIDKQKSAKISSKNEKAIEDLSNKYSSISHWDSSSNYTYVLQEMFMREHRPISFEGYLKDITKTDSTYLLRVYRLGAISDHRFVAQISIAPEKFIELIKQLKSGNHSRNGCFIFKVSKIISALPDIKINYGEDEGDSYSHFEYDYTKTLLLFKGELTDFYLEEITDSN